MKNAINTIITALCLIGITQNYSMDQETKDLTQALEFGMKNGAFCNNNLTTNGMDLNNMKPATHSVSIVIDRANIGNNKVTIVSDFNKLQNKIGEEGLITIHNALLKQYVLDKDDAFADFEPLAIVFNKTNNTNNKQKLNAIIFARERVNAEQEVHSNNSQPSLATVLQNWSTKDETLYEKFVKSITKKDKNTKNNTSNNKTYLVAAGISISIFVLLYIANKLNLLPDFSKTNLQACPAIA